MGYHRRENIKLFLPFSKVVDVTAAGVVYSDVISPGPPLLPEASANLKQEAPYGYFSGISE